MLAGLLILRCAPRKGFNFPIFVIQRHPVINTKASVLLLKSFFDFGVIDEEEDLLHRSELALRAFMPCSESQGETRTLLSTAFPTYWINIILTFMCSKRNKQCIHNQLKPVSHVAARIRFRLPRFTRFASRHFHSSNGSWILQRNFITRKCIAAGNSRSVFPRRSAVNKRVEYASSRAWGASGLS